MEEIKKLPLVEIEWSDACDRGEQPLNKLLKCSTNNYFVKRKCVGWMAKQDDSGVVIITDIDEHNVCEITAIPMCFIDNIKQCKE